MCFGEVVLFYNDEGFLHTITTNVSWEAMWRADVNLEFCSLHH